MWAVFPLLTPWNGDLRRNPLPYVYGRNVSGRELDWCNSVKRELESRGIACYVDVLIEEFE